MLNLWRWWGLALGGMMLAGPGMAMDLLQAYQEALTQDATVRAARASAEAARERLPQARSQLYPNVSLSMGRSLNDLSRTQANFLGQPTTTDERYFSHNQSLTLRQPIYRKALSLGVTQAGYVVEDAEAVLERELQNLTGRVAGAYLEILLAQDQMDLILVQKRVITTQLDAAAKTMAAGAGTRTDIDEAQARLDLIHAQELEARQHLDYTRRQLEVLINRTLTDALVPVNPARLSGLPPLSGSVGDWMAVAETSSPEIQALKARREAARMEVEKAKAGHHPTVDMVAQVVRSASENVTTPSSSYVNRQIGLQLNVPLYAGGYVSSVIRQAQAEWVRADEALEAARRDLSVRVHRELRGVTEGVMNIKAYEQAVRSAEQLVISSRRSFEAGGRTLVDVLNAEQQKQVALRDLARSRYVYLISRIRLQGLVGADRMDSMTQANACLTRD